MKQIWAVKHPVGILQRPRCICIDFVQDISRANQVLDNFDADFHIRGNWQRQRPASPFPSRFGQCTFVYKSRLYVQGGEAVLTDVSHTRVQDFWCMDLQRMDEWRQLPGTPYNLLSARRIIKNDSNHGAFKMFVHKSCAYLFVGTKDMPRFDLETEEWDLVQSTCQTSWPYRSVLRRASTAIYKDILYCFGGSTLEHQIGNNVLMKLDMKTMIRSHLTGTAHPHARYGVEPSMRTGKNIVPALSQKQLMLAYPDAQCWVDTNTERFYVYSGCVGSSLFSRAICPDYLCRLYAFLIPYLQRRDAQQRFASRSTRQSKLKLS